MGTRYNKLWVALWVVSCIILVGMLYQSVSPAAWVTAAFFLFMIPEMIGLIRREDSLPPLTYTVRRYLPRWIPTAVTWAVAAWMFYVWCIPVDGMTQAQHPLLAAIAIFGVAGWLTNHWDVTYDGPPE